ncbi:hypothetical protein AB0H83_47355 [Dactylosporangium sp. NPDC050688]|uniref:hypothetical protein n=1 Tax=Dactylosporangium sp. NPDC050688 TaxID=3157217 RepID=UPI00340F59CE
MDVDLCYQKLWEAIRTVVLNLRDDEIEEIRELYCVDLDNRGTGFRAGRLKAPAQDADRWRAATQTVVAAIRSVQERDWEARGRLSPPYQIWEGLRWRLRRGRLQREYDAQRVALEDEVRAAYRAYRDAAADLTDHVAAWRERQAREQQEREARRRAERVAAVQEGVDGAVWAYLLRDYAGHGQVLIWLPAVDHADEDEGGDARHGLTAREVQQVIEQERARDQYVWIGWKETTGEAMAEWHTDRAGERAPGDARVRAWTALTGAVVEPIVWRPGELEKLRASWNNRGYGPSSNYWSPSGSF